MTSSSLTVSQTYLTGKVRTPGDSFHGWKNCATSSTRTSPPTGSNRTGPFSSQMVTTRRTHLRNMRTILLKLTTSFCLHRFSKLLLQKMFANCCRTKTRPDSRWMRPTKLSLRSTELNKTSASPQRSTCMRSRISITRRRWP